MNIKDSYLHGDDEKGVIKTIELIKGNTEEGERTTGLKLTRANKDKTTEDVPFGDLYVNAEKLLGILPVNHGGTGNSTLSGIIVGNGNNPMSAITVNSDSTNGYLKYSGSTYIWNTPVESIGGKVGEITLLNGQNINGAINLNINNENQLSASIIGLGEAAFKNVDASGITASSTSTNIPTTVAIVSYINTIVGAANALVYKGSYEASANSGSTVSGTFIDLKDQIWIPPTENGDALGYLFVCTSSGYFATEKVEVGDLIICKSENPGNVLSRYMLVQKNIDPTAYVTLAGDQIITGQKTFTSNVVVETINNYTLKEGCSRDVKEVNTSFIPSSDGKALIDEQALKYALDGTSTFKTENFEEIKLTLSSASWTKDGLNNSNSAHSISLANKETGSYMIQIKDVTQNTLFTGLFSHWKNATNNNLDEIPLHMNASAASTSRIYAATQQGYLVFSCNGDHRDSTGIEHTLQVTIKRII